MSRKVNEFPGDSRGGFRRGGLLGQLDRGEAAGHLCFHVITAFHDEAVVAGFTEGIGGGESDR
ncbi:MAG: hypothetical protein QNL68_04465 [Akkermansiaceae bacterium]|jgi:hypothetical protein